MTRYAAKRLKEGERVYWLGDSSNGATVMGHIRGHVLLKWDDKKYPKGFYSAHHNQDNMYFIHTQKQSEAMRLWEPFKNEKR